MKCLESLRVHLLRIRVHVVSGSVKSLPVHAFDLLWGGAKGI